MLDELLEVTHLVDFEDYGSLFLNCVEYRGDELVLSLEVHADEYPDIHPLWQVFCSGIKEHSLSLGYAYDLRYSEDHVLLMPHTAPRSSTFFNGLVDDPLLVVGGLYERHRKLVRDWIPFQRFFNVALGGLPKLIGAGFGVLAEGPRPLILAYEDVMKGYGFLTSHRDPRRSSYWSRSELVEQTVPVAALILDHSFVVAEKFRVVKI